jgi:hypothetical protein
MVTILSLWLPILLSAVVVWIISALVWTVLPHHKSDYKPFPDEDATRKALLPQELKPGLYNIPNVADWNEMKKPEVIKKFEDGPNGFFTVVSKGVPKMGKSMVMSFIYYLVVGLFIAYVASRTLLPADHYLAVFRVVGTTAWLAYGFGLIPEAIWFGRPWSSIIKHLIDSLVYALFTAGVFGWLWV